MIVDSSAFVAIIRGEPEAAAFVTAMERAPTLAVSAGTSSRARSSWAETTNQRWIS